MPGYRTRLSHEWPGRPITGGALRQVREFDGFWCFGVRTLPVREKNGRLAGLGLPGLRPPAPASRERSPGVLRPW